MTVPDWNSRDAVRASRAIEPTEEALQDLLKSFDKRMQRLSDQYLQMMGEHLADIGTLWPSDVHRLQQIRRMNKNLSALRRRIANAAHAGEKEIQKAFELIAGEDTRMATKILGMPDTLSVSSNAYLKNILQAQALETMGRMENLANSTVSSDAYRRAVDRAVSAVQSGVEDYGSAIRRSIREAGQMGLRVRENGTQAVEYASGHTRRLDSAVRMNILDGVRHLNQSIMDEMGRQLGADGIEIDAHMLCAEDHLPYQGRQFSNADFEQIQSGLPRPFGEWNCRHSWHPILLGISQPTFTDDDLRAMQDYSNEEIEIDGRTKTRYQWSQEMRRMETAVRQQKDTATLAKAAGDTQLERRCKGTILQLNEKYKSVAEQAGLKPEFQRTYVPGFRDVKVEAVNVNQQADKSILSPNFNPETRRIDYAAAASFTGSDTRLINMLRTGSPSDISQVIREVLDRDYPNLRRSKWSGETVVKTLKELKYAGGRKHESCQIWVCENLRYDVSTLIHEELHARSSSWFSKKDYIAAREYEEGVVEYITQEICKLHGISHTASYGEFVGPLRYIRSVVAPNETDLDFAMRLIDIPLNQRYNEIVAMIQGSEHASKKAIEKSLWFLQDMGQRRWK